jgi:hypothetical protein
LNEEAKTVGGERICMKVNEVLLGRKFNLGNYESAEVRLSVSPDPEEQGKDWEKCVDELFNKLNTRIVAEGQKLKGVSKEKELE